MPLDQTATPKKREKDLRESRKPKKTIAAEKKAEKRGTKREREKSALEGTFLLSEKWKMRSLRSSKSENKNKNHVQENFQALPPLGRRGYVLSRVSGVEKKKISQKNLHKKKTSDLGIEPRSAP